MLNLLEIYPLADVFTLTHSPSKTKWLSPNLKIKTSFIDKLPFASSNPIYYTPFYTIACEQFDFSGYDILISTTSTIGHSFITPPQTLFVCYAHNINRHLYYPTNLILKPLLKFYRRLDYIFGQRPDYYLTNSHTVEQRIKEVYCRPSQVINPGIDTEKFTPSVNPPGDYFLVVSRLVDHKRIDLAINACHKLGKKLIIIGLGRNTKKITDYVKSLNNTNIKILGQVSDRRLIDLYQHCQALICPQEEDFGLTPLEVQSCGRPVIAYNKGGVTETVIANATGIFFDNQTVDSLINAINQFEQTNFNSNDCRTQALRFSDKSFMLNFKQQVDNLWHQHQTITY